MHISLNSNRTREPRAGTNKADRLSQLFVERQVSYSSCKQKNDITQGASGMGKNDVTWEQANAVGMPPDPKINKAE